MTEWSLEAETARLFGEIAAAATKDAAIAAMVRSLRAAHAAGDRAGVKRARSLPMQRPALPPRYYADITPRERAREPARNPWDVRAPLSVAAE